MSVSEKLQAFLQKHNIKYKLGDNGINFADPFKKPDKRLTLYYYFDTGLCKGYRSQFKGNLYEVVAEIEQCSFGEARRIIGETSTVSFQTRSIAKEEPETEVGRALPPYCEPLVGDPYLSQAESWKHAMRYLINRGFDLEDIKRYQLHFCYGGDQDWRIVIPYFEDGKFVFWQARDTMDGFLRYTFPKKEEYGVGAGDFLYNIDQQTDTLVLCEGLFDAMTIGGAALGGSSLSKNQLLKILRKGFKKVLMAIDNDRAGHQMLDTIVQQLYPYGIEVSYAIPEGGKDWNEIGKVKAHEIIDNAKPYYAPLKILKRFNL